MLAKVGEKKRRMSQQVPLPRAQDLEPAVLSRQYSTSSSLPEGSCPIGTSPPSRI